MNVGARIKSLIGRPPTMDDELAAQAEAEAAREELLDTKMRAWRKRLGSQAWRRDSPASRDSKTRW